MAAVAATAITDQSEKWPSFASTAAVINAVSPGTGTPADSIATAAKSRMSPYWVSRCDTRSECRRRRMR
jgi:hypothetical protein